MQEIFKSLQLENEEMYNEITKVFLTSQIEGRKRGPTVELWMV